MAFALRPRKSINYKDLNDEEPIPCARPTVRRKQLQGIYSVERLIWRKQDKDGEVSINEYA